MKTLLFVISSVFVTLLAGCADQPSDNTNEQTLTEAEMAVEPSDMLLDAEPIPQDEIPAVIRYDELKGDIDLAIFREDAYIDQEGRWVLDMVVGSFAMVPVVAATELGSSVSGMPINYRHGPGVSVKARGNKPGITKTDGQGQAVLVFDVTGDPREEVITITADDYRLDLVVNILSSEANNYSALHQLEGVVHWKELIKAEVSFVPGGVQASFPPELAALHQQEVQLVGFMMPLDATPKQQHFVLTSSPPSCFYHIPGGIAGGVEVFAKDAIEVSWEPVLLKGKLKIYEQNSVGVIYQLLDATLEELKLPEPN